MDKEINLITYINPFTSEHTRLPAPIVGNLVDTIDHTGLTFPSGINCIILLNGEVVKRENWEFTFPKEGDLITLKVIPQGGGGGKNIMRAVMTIALIAGTWGTGALFAGAWQGGMGTFLAGNALAGWAAVGINTALTYAGMLLIDKIAPLPTTSTSRKKEDEPKTWGIESTSNRQNPWGAVPVLLGRHRFHPPFAAMPYSEIVGDDQYINMLFCIGYYPMMIEDLKLGVTDLDDYIETEIAADETNRNIEFYVHENYNNNSTTLKYFRNDIYEDGNSNNLTYNNAVTRQTQPSTDEFVIDITAPNGVYGFSSSGSKTLATVDFSIEYRKNGTSNWYGGVSGMSVSANNFAIALPGNAVVVASDAEHGSETEEVTGYSYTRIGIDKSNGGWWTANSGTLSQSSAYKAQRRCPNFPGYVAPIAGVTRVSNVTNMNNTSVTDLRTDEINSSNATSDFVPGASGNNAFVGAGTLYLEPTISAATSATIRRSYRFKMNESATWDIRVTRLTVDHDPTEDNIYDEIVWSCIRSIDTTTKPVTLDGITLVELRVKASEQFNGSLDDFTVLATSKCDDWIAASSTWSERPTVNPASLFRFLLQGPFNKRPLADESIDLDALATWHDYCVGMGFAFNLYVDYQTSLFEMLVNIAAAGRSSPTYKDGKYSIVTDSEQTIPVQHFTPRTSWGFSSSKTFYDPPHAFRITMADENQDYRTEEAFVYDDGYNSTNATLFEELKLIGCTSFHDAWMHGRFHLAQLRLRPETFKINVDIENLVCTRGDLVRVTHDVPMWGQGVGRIKSTNYNNGEISSIVVDEIFSMNGINNYSMRVRTAIGGTVYKNVTTVAGNNNTLTFSPAIMAVDHNSIIINGDFESWSNGANAAPDTWYAWGGGANNVAQNSVLKKSGNYSARLGSVSGFTAYMADYYNNNEKPVSYWKGRTVSFGAFVLCDVANRAQISLYDGIGWNLSAFHTGSNNWEWLSTTRTINNNANMCRCYFTIANNFAYFDGAVLVEANNISAAFPQTGDLLMFGEAGEESVECLVKGIRPVDDLCAEVELMDYSPAVYTSDTGTIPDYDTHITAQSADLAPIIYSVRSDERVMIKRGIIWSCRILVNFKPRTSERLKEISHIEGNYKVAYSAAAWLGIANITKDAASVYIDNVEQGVTYWLRFRYIYKDGHAGPWCSTYSHEVVGKSGYPTDAAFDDANCEFTANRIQFAMMPMTDFDFDVFEIRTDTSFGSTAELIIQTKSLRYIYTGLIEINDTYYLKAKDTSGNYSLNYDTITAGTADTLDIGTITADFSTNDCFLSWEGVDPLKFSYYQVYVYSDSGYSTLIYTSNQFTNPTFMFDYATNSGTSGGPYRTLYFRVYVHDIYGRSDYSSATATNTAPAVITDLVMQAGIEMLVLVCSPMFADIIGYEFACDTDNPPTDSVEVGTNFASFQGLTAGVTYYGRARAKDYFGYGNWSNVANATPESVTIDPQTMDIPITDGANWNASAGNILWDAHTLSYKGVTYNVAAGNAGASLFVYWNAASNNNVYNNEDTVPLDGDKWIMCYRQNNNAHSAFQQRIIHGGLIQANTIHANRIQTNTLFVSNIVGNQGSLNFTASGSLSFASATGNFTISAGNITISAASGMNISSANGIIIQTGSGISVAGNASTPGVIRIYRNGLTANAMTIGGWNNRFEITPANNNTETLQFGNSTMRWSQLQLWAQNNLYLGSGQFIDLYVGANAFVALGSNNIITLWCSSGLEIHGDKHNNSLTNITCMNRGTYVGNNANNRGITTGFPPKYVRILRTGSAAGSIYTYETPGLTTFDGGANLASYTHLATAYYSMNNYIVAFNNTGFTINSMANAFSPNNNGNTYEWVAYG